MSPASSDPVDSAEPPRHPWPQALPPDGRYCDLVLQGGVVSGVVYPRAVTGLARKYAFKNLGGTSVGALAAAVTAAAEFRRRHVAAEPSRFLGQDGFEGFRGIDHLPAVLAERCGDGSLLRSLFQAQPGLERVLDLFVRAARLPMRPLGVGPALRFGLHLLWLYRGWALVGALLAGVALVPAGGLAALPAGAGWVVAVRGGVALGLLLLCATLASLVGLLRDLIGPMVSNGFGLCTLGDEGVDPVNRPGLTRWLYQQTQALANKPEDRPLTFGDLAAAPGGPPGDACSIRLRTVATNLTLGRPWVLPTDDDEERLFFKPSELRRYFPPAVMRWMEERSSVYAPKSDGDPPASEATACLRELPGCDLPIVVAARLSLSFPVLIAAVPLYAVNREPRDVAQRRLERCWFSDGGLCANFPIHFFDAALPRWPTFGIALGQRSREWPDQPVWLPHFHTQGRGDVWDGLDDPGAGGLKRLLNFGSCILSSMKDWNDRKLARLPGVRDRVVRIGFAEGESELDLDVPGEDIKRMADAYGPAAAAELLGKFLDETAADGLGRGWHEHRWVRFHTLLGSLGELLRDFADRADTDRHAEPLAALTERAFLGQVLAGDRAGEAGLNAVQAGHLDALRAALVALERSLAEHGLGDQPYQPQPRPVLRQRPPM